MKIEVEGQSRVFPIRMMHRALQLPASFHIGDNESMCVTLMLTLPPGSGLCRLMVTKDDGALQVPKFSFKEIEDAKIQSHLQGQKCICEMEIKRHSFDHSVDIHFQCHHTLYSRSDELICSE